MSEQSISYYISYELSHYVLLLYHQMVWYLLTHNDIIRLGIIFEYIISE